MWIPQIRYERTFRWADTDTLRAQIAGVATQEAGAYQGNTGSVEVEPIRPGIEGRLEYAHTLGGDRRFEIAPGFHWSTSHVQHVSIPSRVWSLDWFANPVRKVEISGAFFSGQDLAHLGNGGIGTGFVVYANGSVKPVHSIGGWGQIALLPAPRLSFHLFTGQQDDSDTKIPGRIGKNLLLGANVFYRIAPNFILSFETTQLRTLYVNSGYRLNNHYDLGVAYLF